LTQDNDDNITPRVADPLFFNPPILSRDQKDVGSYFVSSKMLNGNWDKAIPDRFLFPVLVHLNVRKMQEAKWDTKKII
jgi:hypothetical protein